MAPSVAPEELEFVRRVDELGAQGLTQEQIAAELGMSRFQVRHRLKRSFFAWGAESRVRSAITGERLVEMELDAREPAGAAS